MQVYDLGPLMKVVVNELTDYVQTIKYRNYHVGFLVVKIWVDSRHFGGILCDRFMSVNL